MNKEGESLLRKAARWAGLVDARQTTEQLWAIRPGLTLEQSLPVQAQHGDGDPHPFMSVDSAGVARVSISGSLQKQPSVLRALGCSSAATLPEIGAAIRDATARPDISEIVLEIDSPGGTVAGTADVAAAVYAARGVKPIRAEVADQCCSAAYWIASQADSIEAGTTAEIGSIGTYAVVTDLSGAADAVGAKVHVISSGGVKGAGVPGSEVTDEHLENWQREVDAINEIFVESVARGRGMTVEEVQGLADGRVHIGRHALELGLVDSITGAANAGRSVDNNSATGATTEGDGMSAETTKPVASNVTIDDELKELREELRAQTETQKIGSESLAQELAAAKEQSQKLERALAAVEVEKALSSIAPAVLADGSVLETLVDLKMSDAKTPSGASHYDVFLEAVSKGANIAALTGDELATDADSGGGPTTWDARTPEAKALHAKRGLSDERVAELDAKYGFMKSIAAPVAPLEN